MKLDSNNHSVFLLHYHLILVIKYRREVITVQISKRLKEIFEYIQPTYKVTLQEWISRRNFLSCENHFGKRIFGQVPIACLLRVERQ